MEFSSRRVSRRLELPAGCQSIIQFLSLMAKRLQLFFMLKGLAYFRFQFTAILLRFSQIILIRCQAVLEIPPDVFQPANKW